MKLPVEVQEGLTSQGVEFLPYEDMIPFVQTIATSVKNDQKVWIIPRLSMKPSIGKTNTLKTPHNQCLIRVYLCRYFAIRRGIPHSLGQGL